MAGLVQVFGRQERAVEGSLTVTKISGIVQGRRNEPGPCADWRLPAQNDVHSPGRLSATRRRTCGSCVHRPD